MNTPFEKACAVVPVLKHSMAPFYILELVEKGMLTRGDWLRIRGVGKCAVEKLRAAGMVSPSLTSQFNQVSVRLQTVLYQRGIDTIDQAKALVTSGLLKPENTRNYGKKSHRELCLFLGVPNENFCRCDKCGQKLPTRTLQNSK